MKVVVEILSRIFIIFMLVAGVVFTKPYCKAPVQQVMLEQLSEAFDTVGNFTTGMVGRIDFDALQQRAASIISSLTGSKDESSDEAVITPELSAPESQFFSIGNIELGDSRESVEDMYGAPERESLNEYGGEWTAYHEDYQNFMMVV